MTPSSSSTRAARRVVDLNPAALRLTGLTKRQGLAIGLGDLFYSTGPGGIDQLALALGRHGVLPLAEGSSCGAGGPPPAGQRQREPIHTDPEPVGLVVRRDVGDTAAGGRRTQRVGGTVHRPGRVDGGGRLGARPGRIILSLSPPFEPPSAGGARVGRPPLRGAPSTRRTVKSRHDSTPGRGRTSPCLAPDCES